MKRLLSIMLLLGIVATGFAISNTYPMVTIGYSFNSDAKFNDPYDNDTGLGGVTIGMKTMDVDFAYPMFFHNNRTIFIPSGEYSYVESFYKHEPEHTNNQKMTDFQIGLRLYRDFGSSFRIKAHVAPGLSSDYRNDISSDDFVLRGGLTIDLRLSEYLSMEAGAVYDTPFGRQEIVPVLGATWEKGDFYASALLPLSVDVRWKWNREMTFGVLGNVSGYHFNIKDGEPEEDEIYDDDFQVVDYLEYSRVDVGPIVYWNIFDNFWFDIQSGVTFRKNFRFYDKDEEEMRFMDYSSEPSWFLSITTRYRIPMPE